MNRWTKQDHEQAAYKSCPKPCIGGRMMWGWAEPQWKTDLGLVGTCTHCGTEAFTTDILNEVVLVQPRPNQPQRRSGPSTHNRGYQGGWKNNHGLFKTAS
jgi:hypothetical protein